MEKIWLVLIVIAVFSVSGFIFYKSMRSYVREEFGKKWLKIWGNKIYFWQSLVFASGATTVLVLFLLKWAQIVTF